MHSKDHLTFAERVLEFNKQLHFSEKLPDGIHILNPFKENKRVLRVAEDFYKKYYNDNHTRHLILGINPGRFGGGITGIPFTDPKRLKEKCGIDFQGELKHEPSSVFVYEVIDAYGGAASFYKNFYISSVCPLGFTKTGAQGKEVNYNYYDSKALTEQMYPFIVQSLKKQLDMGIARDVVFCFGNDKNEKFIRRMNEEHQFFKRVVGLEHPRFVMQYKSKSKSFYIEKYVSAFHSINKA